MTKYNIIFTEGHYFLKCIGQAVDQLRIRSQNGSTLLANECILLVNNPCKAELKHPQRYGNTLKVLQNLLS